MAAESPPEPASAPALDRDVYCPACDRNLRGLPGDPIRCPTCGQYASVGIPDEAALRQLRAIDSAKWFAGAFILGLLLVACGMYCVQYGVVASAVPGTGGVFIGTAGAYAFRRTCLGRPGWFRALLWYITWSLAGVGLALLVIGALAVLVLLLLDRVWNSKAADYFKSAIVGLCFASVAYSSDVFGGLARRPLRRILLRGRPAEPP